METFENYELQDLVKIDSPAPSFTLPYYDPKTGKDGKFSLADQKGKWTVLFFYPADFTFVCPTELKDMADKEQKFSELGVDVISLSTDSIYSHKAWVESEKLMENFPYKMIADKMTTATELYNLLDEEEGQAGRGTFIIDPDLVVRGIEVTSGPLGRNSEELLRKVEALQFMRENPNQACPANWVAGNKTLTPSLDISGKVGEELEK